MIKRLFARLSGQYVAEACHHRTKRKGEVRAFGACTTTAMPLTNGTVKWCLSCIGSMAIRCAWCEEVIFIGDPVTLYTPTKPDFSVPEHAIVYSENPLQLVGCLRMNCAESGADRAGFWIPGEDGKGSVERVATPFELVMATGRGVVVNDLSSMKEAGQLQADAFRSQNA